MGKFIHSAHFWLKKDLSAEDRAFFEEELKLLSQAECLEAGYAGPPAATENREVVDNSFHYSTSFHFKSLEDHEYYQSECPAHARFVKNCRSFFERVVVRDMSPF